LPGPSSTDHANRLATSPVTLGHISTVFPLSTLRTHGRLLGFGFFMCLCSNFGQTYFIALFGGEVRAAFDLSHGGFGTVYSLATLTSAAILIWAGRFVDRVSMASYSTVVLLGLAGACFIFGFAASEAALVVALLFLRLFGQGLSNHAGITAMARYFDSFRGRAVSIANMGFPAGVAVFPTIVVLALATYSWREIWLANGVIVVLAVPVMLVLLSDHNARHAAHVASRAESGAMARDHTLGEALRGVRFWLRMPALLAPSFISTGLVFHQVHIADIKGWSMTLLSGSFSAYAALTVVAALLGGPLVDSIGARRLTRYFLVPLAAAALVIVFFDGAWLAPVFFGFLGASAGITAVILGALWAELYGISHLGAIRAFGQAAMVFSTGLSPVVFGVLIDQGIKIEAIAGTCAVYCVFASVLARAAESQAER